jgi:hypothetical protein
MLLRFGRRFEADSTPEQKRAWLHLYCNTRRKLTHRFSIAAFTFTKGGNVTSTQVYFNPTELREVLTDMLAQLDTYEAHHG